MQVQNGQGVLGSLVSSILDIGLACWGSIAILYQYIYFKQVKMMMENVASLSNLTLEWNEFGIRVRFQKILWIHRDTAFSRQAGRSARLNDKITKSTRLNVTLTRLLIVNFLSEVWYYCLILDTFALYLVLRLAWIRKN